jgi:hypothetical protein
MQIISVSVALAPTGEGVPANGGATSSLGRATTPIDVVAVPSTRPTTIPEAAQVPLLDADGAFLCPVAWEHPPRDNCLPLSAVSEPSVLLSYCFGRGRREVLLDLREGVVEGWLGTRWKGDHRGWWIELV